MSDFILKPVEPHVLLKTLSQWITPSLARVNAQGARRPSIKPPAKANHPPIDDAEANICVPGIDALQGLQKLGGNLALFVDLLNEFATCHANDVRKLHQAILTGDIEKARHIIHTLLGVTGNLCANRFTQLLTQLAEAMGGDPAVAPSSRVGELIDQMQHASDDMLAAIQKLANTHHKNPPKGGKDAKVDPNKLIAIIEKLHLTLEQYDPVGAELHSVELFPMLEDKVNKNMVDTLEHQINVLDFDAAVKTLARIKKAIQSS